VVCNVVDSAIFLSLPILILLVIWLPALLQKSYLAVRWGQVAAWVPLTVAGLSSFVVLDLAGISRGDVSRIWAYFGPLFLLLALALPAGGPQPASVEIGLYRLDTGERLARADGSGDDLVDQLVATLMEQSEA
jgi:hypothetical protein